MSLATWSPACNNSRLSCCSLLVLRLRQSFSYLNPVLCHWCPIRPQLLTVSALASSAQLIILLIMDFPQYRCHCRRSFSLSTGNNTSASSSACSVIAASVLLFSAPQPPYGASANSCALRAPRSPQSVLEPRRVRPSSFPCVKPGSYLA